jgi:DNA polymerase III alpha subunit (gram-positive type)
VAREVYVSTDIEADGKAPGLSSMLSLASVAYSEDGEELSSFSVNLTLLPGAVPDPATMAWWAKQTKAWAACRSDVEDPATAMPRYVAWLRALPGKPVFVAYPAGFDFPFVAWYLHRFAGGDPFSFAALDLKTFAWALLGGRFRDAAKRNFPRAWFTSKDHNHIALDDAREQGEMFVNMLRAWRAAGGTVPLGNALAADEPHDDGRDNDPSDADDAADP